MLNRREFLRSGLSAAAIGLAARRGAAIVAPPQPCTPGGGLDLLGTRPLLGLGQLPESVIVDGLPFSPWWSGDDWQNGLIPFHSIPDYFGGGGPPAPTELTDVVVIGGGIAGLSTAYLLRHRRPVLLETRARFGGNAMGERWLGIPFSLGSAYFITPDPGSFLNRFYRRLGLHRDKRVSQGDDPVEIGGAILNDFWSGAGRPPEEVLAFQRYAATVDHFAGDAYPEIPLPEDPAEVERIHALDRVNFRQDVEARMQMPMPPLLAAAVQAYFYSSFGVGMDEVSAAAGWNFVAAEEYGRWVLPGGNTGLVEALWEELSDLERHVPPACRPRHLRAGCRVIDVRPLGANTQVTYIDSVGAMRSIEARQVAVCTSAHVAKHIVHDLGTRDPGKLDSLHAVNTVAYLVANILLQAPVDLDFYDAFLVGDAATFPMTQPDAEAARKVTDALRGDYAHGPHYPGGRSVLTLYWPLPWHSARFTLIVDEGWAGYAQALAPQLRAALATLGVPDSAVRQVRLTRWGHAMPVARPGFIADGHADAVRRPLGTNIHFAGQDNFALPAVENTILEANRVAGVIDALL